MQISGRVFWSLAEQTKWKGEKENQNIHSKLAVLGTSSAEEPVKLMDNVKEMKKNKPLRDH